MDEFVGSRVRVTYVARDESETGVLKEIQEVTSRESETPVRCIIELDGGKVLNTSLTRVELL